MTEGEQRKGDMEPRQELCVVTEIGAMGYGNPESHISYKQKIENGDFPPELINASIKVIKSGKCVCGITESGDGCMDGRLAEFLMWLGGIEGEDYNTVDIHDHQQHLRYKVAGGGYITALAMKLALDPQILTVGEDLNGVAEHLTHLGIYCGTHTGERMHEQGSDCGANDKLKEILHVWNKSSSHIDQTIKDLMGRFKLGDTFSEDIAARTGAGLLQTLEHKDYFTDSDGKKRFGIIMSNIDAVQKTLGSEEPITGSKHLKGSHNEAFIVINTVKKKTFSQALFRKELQARFPTLEEEKLPMAFAIDVPRIVELAEAMAIGRPNKNEAFEIALYAGLAFQFATAATLTDGTLPMFICSEN